MAAIRFNRFCLAAFLCAILPACGGSEPQAQDAAPKIEAERVVASACQEVRFEDSLFTACRYDARRHRIELILDGPAGPLRSLIDLEAHLGTRAGTLRFAMNAGMFDEDGKPIGLYVENGRERRALNRRSGAGNFHLEPNGVFSVTANGRVQVSTSAAFAAQDADTRWATQSGPMLVIGGALHPAFDADGESRHIRNGVGVADERTAWFVISEEPVSFGRFARLFRDALGCRNALYLDGSVSSLWDRPAGRQDAFASLGPLVAVFDVP